MGDASPTGTWGKFVEGVTGSTGLGATHKGPLGMSGLADILPFFMADEGGRKLATPGQRVGGALETAMAVVPIPAAAKGVKAIKGAMAKGPPTPPKTRPAMATHEATPGIMTGHLPGITTGSPAVRAAYSTDPRSTWVGPDGHDIIYGSMGVPTRRTVGATGMYTPPGGAMETNPAQVARPLVDLLQDGSAVAPASRTSLNAGESARAYLDAQGAGAWHIPLEAAPSGDRGSVFVPADRPMSVFEMLGLKGVGERHGVGDVVDTGRGATMTNFYPGPPTGAKMREALEAGEMRRAVGDVLPGAEPRRVKVDSGYIGYEDAWAAGEGSGAVTRELESHLTPEVVRRLDADPAVRAAALARLERDAEVAARTGQPLRQDVQNARRIVAESGFSGLLAALQRGELLPAVALPLLGLAAQQGQGE